MKTKLIFLPSAEACYYWVAEWGLYHLVRPVLQIVTDPLFNWIEERLTLRFIPRHSLKTSRLLLDRGSDPSGTGPELDYFFSAIQGGVWTLGWTYSQRYNQQHIKDLMEAGFLDEALTCVRKCGADTKYPWEKRVAAEIRALQAGRPLPPVIKPAEGPICWSIQKVLTEELPRWKKEDTDYIIAELYLRWGYRTAPDGRKRAIKPEIWDRVMEKIKERFRHIHLCRFSILNRHYNHEQFRPSQDLVDFGQVDKI